MTGKLATRAAAASVADVEKIVAAAAKAFETWSETGPSMGRAQQLFLEYAARLDKQAAIDGPFSSASVAR
jgi:acyl-CoA reductase-like NAD-dependent aldehyde dehydrogenase